LIFPQGIMKEDKMGHVNTHSEFVKGIVMYEKTGDRPHDKFFNRMDKQFEHNPEKFTTSHPSFAGFFTRAEHIGDLPGGHYWQHLKHRFLLNPIRFEENHCKYIVGAIKASLISEAPTSPTTPIYPIHPIQPIIPVNPVTPIVPEAPSIFGVCVGILIIFLIRRKSH